MAELSLQTDGPETKRRKVRKGTRNCWECKRRKVRCIFSTPTDPICNSCKRRGTACIGQEHPDSPVPPASSNQIEARLGRVESFIQQLVNNTGTAHALESLAQDPSEPRSTLNGPEGRGEHQPESGLVIGRTSNNCAGVASQAEATASLGRDDCNTEHVLDHGTFSRSEPPLELPSPVTAISQVEGARAANKYEELARALTAAWPSQHALDIIYTLPVGVSAHLHRLLCIPYSDSMDQDPPSPREMLQLPPPGSHPVLIARKLLTLGTFLQGVLPSSMQDLAGVGTSLRNIMARVVDRAIRLVTTDDDLVRSVEGIECILIEAMYQNYAGNLHQSWMAVRRGTAVAQMMALHRGFNSPFLKTLEPETRLNFNPDYLYFRLVDMERYLSLLLGLPQSSSEAHFATPKALIECHPIDRMQRYHCTIAGRILKRNDADVIDFAETQEIDELMQKVAAEMPPQWWLIPSFSRNNSPSTDAIHETISLMVQFTHHHLLIRLHLPYMLRSSPDHRHEHSIITTINASRETLALFVAFRTSNPGHFYCRGCDFLAFTATVVLCIAYINCRSKCRGPAENSDPGTVFHFLAHSRPSDRGIMERTLDIIESTTHAGTDVIASKFARIISHLLDIEANAAGGTRYTMNSSLGNEEELEYDGKLANGGRALRVYIPYLGAINFERGAKSKPVSMAPAPLKQGISAEVGTNLLVDDPLDEYSQQMPSGGNWLPRCQMGSALDYSNPPTAPSPQTAPSATSEALGIGGGISGGISGSGNGNVSYAQLPLPEGFAGAHDDWDLQSVDMALFDSLFRGIASPDAVGEETWAQWAADG